MSQASDLAQAPAFNEKIIALKTGSIDAAIARDTHVFHHGQYHWGDITYRYRLEGESAWIEEDSSQKCSAVKPIDTPGSLAASDLGPTLPESPLNIVREWLEVDGDLALRFTVRNAGKEQLEIGSLGLPIEFNSIFTGKTQAEMQAQCCLSDPYIGFDTGHLRVAPVNPQTESASALVVTPLGGTDTPFQAYRNLKEPFFADTAYGAHTFKDLYLATLSIDVTDKHTGWRIEFPRQ